MTQATIVAGSRASFTLSAGSRLLIQGQGTYRVGPIGTSSRPTVDELIDTTTSIGPFSDSCLVQIWATGSGASYEEIAPGDVLDQTGRPISGDSVAWSSMFLSGSR